MVNESGTVVLLLTAACGPWPPFHPGAGMLHTKSFARPWVWGAEGGGFRLSFRTPLASQGAWLGSGAGSHCPLKHDSGHLNPLDHTIYGIRTIFLVVGLASETVKKEGHGRRPP